MSAGTARRGFVVARRYLGKVGFGPTLESSAPRIEAASVYLQVGRASSSSAPPPKSEENATSLPAGALQILGGLTVAGGLAALAFGRSGGLSGGPSGEKISVALKPMHDEVFERTDNMLVLMLEPTELLDRKEEIQRVIRTLAKEPSLRQVSFYYKARPADGTPAMESAQSSSQTLRAFLYKGQRRVAIQIRTDVVSEQLGEIAKFFSPVSEELKQAHRNLEVPRVSGSTFDSDVLSDSTPSRFVLLQMYEDTCFLCFLMRPFINSVARHLREHDVSLKIKRLNLEKNDFPNGCPVARGTPTFVLFRGAGVPPQKWEEFKPNEIVDKLRRTFPKLKAEIFDALDDMHEQLNDRMQLFMKVVMWTVELQKLEQFYNRAVSSIQLDVDPADDPGFDSAVTQMMLKDMNRHDDLQDNLKHLEKEALEVEQDVLVLGLMLAQKVLERERVEKVHY